MSLKVVALQLLEFDDQQLAVITEGLTVNQCHLLGHTKLAKTATTDSARVV